MELAIIYSDITYKAELILAEFNKYLRMKIGKGFAI